MIKSKNKFFLYSFVIFSFSVSNLAFASNADKIKPISPRVGLSGKIEYKKADKSKELAVKVKATVKESNKSKQNPIKEISYNDFDIKQLAKESKWELDDTKAEDLESLRQLWQSALERSETLRFAIYKLSNPNGEEEKQGIVKKILSPLASVSPILGMGSGNVITGSSAILGGSLLGSVLSDDSFVNNKLSRVTDTELVLLAQQTDNLQSTLVKQYYDYKNALERLEKVDEIVKHRYEFYEKSKKKSVEEHSIADVFYREAVDMEYQAKQDVLNSRANLEQLVGNDALTAIETKLKENISVKE